MDRTAFLEELKARKRRAEERVAAYELLIEDMENNGSLTRQLSLVPDPPAQENAVPPESEPPPKAEPPPPPRQRGADPADRFPRRDIEEVFPALAKAKRELGKGELTVEDLMHWAGKHVARRLTRASTTTLAKSLVGRGLLRKVKKGSTGHKNSARWRVA